MIRKLFTILMTVLLSGCGTNSESTSEYAYYKDLDIEKMSFQEAYNYYKEGNSGVLFMAFSDCPYCEVAYPIFREVYNEYKNVPVYYVDITRKEREDGNETYDLWVEALDEFLDPDDKKIYIPTVIALRDGEVTASVVGTVSDLEDMTKGSEIEKQKDAYRNVFYRAGD